MLFIRESTAVFLKDLHQEARTRYIFNSILAFTATSLLIVLFSLRAQDLHDEAKAGIIWIVLLFASLAGLGRSFIAENDRNTLPLLKIHADSMSVFWGKLGYNFLFTLSVTVLSVMAYVIMLNIPITFFWYMAASFTLGILGISTVATLMSAIVSNTSKKGAIFSVISIPLLIPLILIVGKTSLVSFFGSTDGKFFNDLIALVAYNGVTLTASTLLFDFIWED